MRTIFAPEKLEFSEKDVTVFLAGSIEMNTAGPWAEELTDKLKGFENLVLFNPRRKDFDKTAKQTKDDPYFRGQVEWELQALEMCDIVYLYLQPGTKSPISLLELGIYTQTDKLIVCCPEGFWRKGNVDIVCDRYDVPVFDNVEEAFEFLKKKIEVRKLIFTKTFR